MGLRGPKARPMGAKILAGVPGCYINRDEPNYPHLGAVPEPPDFLGPIASDFWRRYAPMLIEVNVLRQTDVPLWTLCCRTWQRVREDPEDTKAADAFLRLAREFGMSPSSRQYLREPQKYQDDLDAFLARKKA